MTLQQGSQTQTPLEAKSSEAGIKTIGNDGSLELGMHALWKGIHISFDFSLFKNKANKKDIVPSKIHLWARTRELAVSETVIIKSQDIQRRVVRI